ncbi:val start codon [Ruminococcus sp. CAG:403]|nr:val start codon [Ruminococcus sp. CAG:403]
MGASGHRTYIGFLHPQRHTIPGCNEQTCIAVRQTNPCNFIVLVQTNGNESVLPHVLIRRKGSPLDLAVLGYHDDIFAVLKIGYTQHCCNLLTITQRQQVDDVIASGGLGTFRNLIALQPVHNALVADEENVIVRGADKHLADEILFPLLHAGNASSASALGLIDIHRHPLHVAVVGIGHHAFLNRNEVFNVHFSADRFNLCPAGIAVLPADFFQILQDNGIDPLFVCQNVNEFRNLLQQGIQFVRNLLPFHTGQLSQTHLHNSFCLLFGQSDLVLQMVLCHVILRTIQQGRHIHFCKPLDQALFALWNGLAGTQNGNDFINIVDGN